MVTQPPLTTRATQPRFSQRRQWAADQVIGFLMQQAVENPGVISLAAGLVDYESLPVAETRAAVARLLSDDKLARQVLQYGTTQGAEFLREQVLNLLARLENTTPGELGIGLDQIILTTGSQQLLSLVSEVLLDPGDICLVAAPTYFVFLSVLQGVGARAIPVETDSDGMRMDSLERVLEDLDARGELDRVKLLYLVSYYENPSGISLAEDRREAAVEIAKRWSRNHQILILEDTAYRELRYDGPAFRSTWSYDSSREQVVLAQTFSKSFSPGLRVGWGVLPKELVGSVTDRKSNEDFGSANFNQFLIGTVIEQGLYELHVEEVCNTYRRKRDVMLEAADKYFSNFDGVSWVHPHGGLYVWMTLPESVDTGFGGELFNRATSVEKVMYVPGELAFAGGADQRAKNHMRLSFGVCSTQEIEEAMRRLSKAVAAVL